jgi:Domain of unknown function (DUF4347)/FG-GAP-like repeat
MTFSTAVIDPALNMPIGPTLTSSVLPSLAIDGATGPARSGAALLFVDAGVSDYQALVAGAQPGTEVYVLDRTQAAIGQITDRLLGRTGISAINILSHGADGELDFASGTLNLANLSGHAGELQAWRAALAAGADILLYGCNVAADGVGQSFVNRMAELTGADVAASSDLTGSAALGGDWTLEYQTGTIQAAALAVADYGSVLATFDVTNTDDSGAGSLRQAIESANSVLEENTINFSGSIFTDAAPDIITLASGTLNITGNLTINAPVADILTVSGNHAFTVFNVARSSVVTMSRLTIANGNSVAYGSGGGGIYNSGTLTLDSSILRGNSTTHFESGGGGGGIYNDGGKLFMNYSALNGNSTTGGFGGGGICNVFNGFVSLNNCVLSGNLSAAAVYGGGGIFNLIGGLVILSSTVINGNSATSGDGGGGIYNYGDMGLNNISLTGNSAVNGGGIYNFGNLNVGNDATLAGNSATNGGGIYNYGTLRVGFSTLRGNFARTDGGGIYNTDYGSVSLINNTLSGNFSGSNGGGIYNTNNGMVSLSSSTLSGNIAAIGGGIYNYTDGSNSTITATNSLFADSSLYGFIPDFNNLVGTAAFLGLDPVLRDNGGSTQTHALLPGSVAINAATQGTSTDQRGLAAVGPRDIGAFEFQGVTEPITSGCQQMDFNGDGKADILWHNAVTGETGLWLMDGATRIGAAFLLTIEPEWYIEKLADFDGNGQGDILWRNPNTQQVAIWHMNGTTIAEGEYLFNEGQDWQVTGSGDFNGDGKADLLWRNTNSGENAVWLIDGAKFSSGYFLLPITDQNWKVTGVADFGGDGRADIVWSNLVTNQSAIWQLDGATFLAADYLTATEENWTVVAIGDFNGNGHSDLVWRNTSTGANAIWWMNGSTIAQAAYITPVADQNWQITGVADLDGTGQVDLLWCNCITGEVARWGMDGTQVVLPSLIETVGDLDWKMVV